MTVAPIRPRSLLLHAEALASHHSGAGRPILTWLRRSTSASYYAVFHGVALAVAGQLAPSCPLKDQHRLARSVDHARVAEVSRWITGKPGAGKEHVQDIVTLLQGSADVRRLAAIFLRLQQARHEADYDHLADVRKATTLAHARQASSALDLLDELSALPDGERFLALVALHTQLR